MRDIKFRGFTINEEKYGNGKDGWIYGNLLLSDNNKAQIQDINDDNFFKFIDIKSIGQYTGLKDKNGTEIYEGDIVKSYYYIPNEDGTEGERYVVKLINYDETLCKYNIDMFENLEIIGNKWDNPELLEEGE